MALDPSIYNNVGRVNLGQGLSDILNQQREREAAAEQRQLTLASLAKQQQAAQQSQSQKRNQELNMWLSSAVQSGRPIEEVMPEAIAKGREINVPDEVTQRHVTSVYGAGVTPQARSTAAVGAAYPELLAKAQIEGAFPKQSAPIAWQHVETDKGIVQVNPQTGEVRPLGITQPVKTGAEGGQRGQIIFDNQGNAFNVNPYTNEVHPVRIGGRQIQGAQFAPGLQGQISGAKERGKTEVETQAEAKKAIKKSDQLLIMATKAEELLKKGPTGSGIGAMLDAGGRLIGNTTESAALASELETVSGWMVANVPRMEGPQSNFDVQNYQTMAAKIGDRTVPVKERLAALKTLMELQGKYKHLNQDIVNGEQTQTPTSPTGAYDADKEARYQAWKAQQVR